MRDKIIKEYFQWLTDLVCKGRFSDKISCTRLMLSLHNTEFVYTIPMDENRAEDGVSLRYRFMRAKCYDTSIMEYLQKPCSMLEMMVALAIRCEEDIMEEPIKGDRTAQWFWGMVVNLGLGSMFDHCYDEQLVDEVLTRFAKRRYDPDGRGGLFRIKGCPRDLRKVEIWYQMCWYLDSIT